MKSPFLSAMLLGCALSLQACAPYSAATTTMAAGKFITDERSSGTIIDDNLIKARITHEFIQADVNDLLINVKLNVHEGRVFMTGKVNTPETMVRAVRLAWSATGVREVVNELIVEENLNLKQYAIDTWITGQMKSKMLLYKDIRSANYSVVTVNGVVYLMGLAQDEEELRLITDTASRIRGVHKVISHARLKESELRPEQG